MTLQKTATDAASEDGWSETLSGAIDAFSYGGEIYGVPINQESTFFFYNERIFDEYGLTPPESFDELLDLCRTLRSNGVTPMSLSSATSRARPYL